MAGANLVTAKSHFAAVVGDEQPKLGSAFAAGYELALRAIHGSSYSDVIFVVARLSGHPSPAFIALVGPPREPVSELFCIASLAAIATRFSYSTVSRGVDSMLVTN